MKNISLFRIPCLVAALILSSAFLFGQPGPQTDAQKELAKYIRDNYDKQEVMIPMRDGVRLFTSIYSPEKKSEPPASAAGTNSPAIKPPANAAGSDRIQSQIQSTWFPLVARNPQRFMANYKLATAASFQKATQRIYSGGRHNSAIILPVLKK